MPGAPELAELIEKMLDRTPKGRPRDGAAVLAALTPIEDRLRAKPADGKPPEHAKRRKATFGDLLAELKRRHVFRVMIGYGVFAFAVLQVTEPIIHGAHLPEWVLTAVLVALALGFPVAVILAWVFDLTSHGVKRTPTGPGAPLPGSSRLLMPLSVAIVVLALAAAGGGAWYAWKRATERRPAVAVQVAIPSVAVLPFADLSPGKDQEYFSDGVAEEILSALSKVAGLRVPGRSSSFYFKKKDVPPSEVAQKLGVVHLLEGSVRRSGNKLRISAELVRAADGERLWSQAFDREATDVFAVQDEIARAVVEALRLQFLPRQGSRIAQRRPTNPETHRLHLLGKQLTMKELADDIEAGIRAFDEAVRLDPGYTPAQAWGAYARYLLSNIGPADPSRYGEPQFDYVRVAQASLRKADELVASAPDTFEAYWVRGIRRSFVSLD